ncbi:hypothetical protein DTO96_102101 [Ephemeroptericola cinctiostellae]|uniref:Uncharacterized protein n=1 Tax=Ephemeroptericola cinctiostellae TaxID=2268024 RepID=A0A345DDB3_9BURK|nr:hypothetical protein DTO96_102101 [Ephemeroptericola cinctiostellae]
MGEGVQLKINAAMIYPQLLTNNNTHYQWHYVPYLNYQYLVLYLPFALHFFMLQCTIYYLN